MSAIRRSCSAAVMVVGSAPRPVTKRGRGGPRPPSRSPSRAMKIQGRRANRLAVANSNPPRAPPPSGWPPTNVTGAGSAAAASTIVRLVPPTSVMTADGEACVGDPPEQDDVLANRSGQHDRDRRRRLRRDRPRRRRSPAATIASRRTGSRSTATTCVDGQARRARKGDRPADQPEADDRNPKTSVELPSPNPNPKPSGGLWSWIVGNWSWIGSLTSPIPAAPPPPGRCCGRLRGR